MAEQKVILYSQPSCPPCYQAKIWLADQKIPFEVRDIRENDKYLEELINLGANATPAFLIGEQVILGFNQSKIQDAWAAIATA